MAWPDYSCEGHIPNNWVCVVCAEKQALIDHLASSDRRHRHWHQSRGQEERMRLQQERHRHGDVVLVPTTDVYRNIPHKLLHFLRW